MELLLLGSIFTWQNGLAPGSWNRCTIWWTALKSAILMSHCCYGEEAIATWSGSDLKRFYRRKQVFFLGFLRTVNLNIRLSLTKQNFKLCIWMFPAEMSWRSLCLLLNLRVYVHKPVTLTFKWREKIFCNAVVHLLYWWIQPGVLCQSKPWKYSKCKSENQQVLHFAFLNCWFTVLKYKNHHLLQCQLICLPVTATQLQRFI